MKFNIIKKIIGDTEVNSVSARTIHKELGLKSDFSTWIKKELELFTENNDYILHKFVENPISGGRPKTEYIVTTDVAKHLCMLQRNSKGMEARQYFIDAEKSNQLPTTFLDAIKQLVITEEARVQLQLENTRQSEKIAQDAPKVLFATNVSQSINSILIGVYGKALSQEYGMKIGQNKLFAFLRSSGILIKSGRRKNVAMQKYIDNNYFTVVEIEVVTPRGIIIKPTTLITGKGQLALADMIVNHFSS